MAERNRNRDPEEKERFEAEKMKAIDDALEMIKAKHHHGGLWTVENKMNAYTLVYDLVSRTPVGPERNSMLKKLDEKYERFMKDMISHKVLPSLRNCKNETEFYSELHKRGAEFVKLSKDVEMMFDYASRFYPNPSHYKELSNKWFCDQVFEEFSSQFN